MNVDTVEGTYESMFFSLKYAALNNFFVKKYMVTSWELWGSQ
jgi:hypothetical protein